MLRKPAAVIGLVGAALLSCGNAWAHGGFGSDTSIWTAPYHLLTSPLSLAALIGLTLVLFDIDEPASFVAAALAALAAVAATTSLSSMAPAVAPGAVVVIGLSAVAGWKPSTGFAFILALLTGLAAGLAADLEQPRWQDLAAMAITVLIATAWLLATAKNISRSGRLQTVLPIARRVLGSWVAAIALLLGALAMLGKPTL